MERRALRNGSPVDTIVEVGETRFGHDPFPTIAGPRAVESEEQIMEVAKAVAGAGAAVLRGGVYESTASPYEFPGLGRPGLELLRDAGAEVGLPTVTKALEPKDVELVASHVDMIHVDPRSMQNFELLRVIGGTGKPVLLERGGPPRWTSGYGRPSTCSPRTTTRWCCARAASVPSRSRPGPPST